MWIISWVDIRWGKMILLGAISSGVGSSVKLGGNFRKPRRLISQPGMDMLCIDACHQPQPFTAHHTAEKSGDAARAVTACDEIRQKLHDALSAST
jgi:hypothetical protein